MRYEQSPMPSPKEMTKIEKQRVFSDADLSKRETDYIFDEKSEKRLEVTDEQIEKSRKEIEKDKSENQENKESPKINFPEDINIVKALQKKLSEYKERLSAEIKKDPYKAPEFFIDTNYKIAILEKLLINGEVNTYELSKELNKKFGGLDIETFKNACSIIKDYAETGGENISGGTGLKFEKKPEEKIETNENVEELLSKEKESKKEDVIEKITPENIENSIKIGKPIEVKVKRSSGKIEKGWIITGSDGKNAIVIKNAEDGTGFIKKVVPIKELQKLNKEVDQEELKKSISEAKSFEDLIKTIERFGGIEGSQEFYDAKSLENIINKVRNKELGITFITKTGGLRQKVDDLLALEKIRKNLESR